MSVTFADARPSGGFALVVPIAKGADIRKADLGLDEATVEAMVHAAEGTRFEGDTGKQVEIFADQDGEVRRVVLVGTGASGEDQAIEKAGGAVAGRLQTSGETKLVFDPRALAERGAAARLAYGALQRGWRHDVYRTRLKDKLKPTVKEIVAIGDAAEAEDWARYEHVYAGIALARELVTEPPNKIYPESFVERCREMEGLGVEFTVLGKQEMETLGMGALLGVGQGSATEPQLLAMRWDGTGGSQERPVALVGKGVTFDTGGISLKPGPGMEDMKFDMGGAAAVAGAMRALAGRKAKAHVIGLCGLVENMPDGKAQRPSDIVTSMSGQTVEVLNTDAEGRLVLADVLTWVQRNHKPRAIVDLATLTGAMIIALGHEYAGCFSNDDGLADQLIAAGEKSGDALWRLPLGKPYDKLLDSPIADMKNVGPREAGSITAAQFLQRFIENDTPWAHLDIAGTAWIKTASQLRDKGATGFGVRLLDRLIADNYEA
ncbi:MAG: leucyl aminopeptidase [Sphingomonadales bacterium]|nr:leucyl aminopeptidase [Sphingomonadales bacterium]